MTEKQKKVRKYNVGKATSKTMRKQVLILLVDCMNGFEITNRQKECHNGQ